MNWTGAGGLTLLVAVMGGWLGTRFYDLLHRPGIEAVWIIALWAAIPTALLARRPSVMRGLLVATVVVWIGAANYGMRATGGGVLDAWLRFHEVVDGVVFSWFATAAIIGVAIASQAPWASRFAVRSRSGRR